MAGYNPYVFDEKKKEFVGNFEEMYRQEIIDNFDSWHQDDLRHVNRKILFLLLEQRNFNNILDIGCGKGALTQMLKKSNNCVTGLDISQTALHRAKASFPDISFEQLDVNNLTEMENYFFKGDEVNLIFCCECLSYLKNWQELVRMFSRHTNHLLLSVFIPENPIGYIKTAKELETVVEKSFNIIEYINLRSFSCHIVYASSRNLKS